MAQVLLDLGGLLHPGFNYGTENKPLHLMECTWKERPCEYSDLTLVQLCQSFYSN